MSTKPCPLCRSRDIRLVDDAWRCNRCDTLFVITDGKAEIRIAGDAPPGGGGGKGAWALAGLLILGAGGVWWVNQPPAKSTAPAAPAASEVPRPRPRPPAREKLPNIDLPFIEAGTREDGAMFWLVTYRNLGKDPIENLAIVAQFYDGGTITGTALGKAPVAQLEPDEETVVLVVAEEPPKHTRIEVAAKPPSFATRTPATVKLGTDGVHMTTNRAGPELIGNIRNPHAFHVRVTDVVVVGRDRSGRPVAWAPAGPDEPNLRPGDETIFEARPGIYEIGEPAVWTAFALGEPVEK